MLSLLLAACAPPAEEPCDWPSAPSAPGGSVEDSCGWYTLAVGEHLVANVHVVEPEVDCEYALDAGLDLPNSPIYSAVYDEPKYTLDVEATSVGEGLLVDVTCGDGTRWLAKVDVE